MLFMSFVVAVPINHRRASPRKGSKLLLWWMCDCDFPLKEGLVFNKSIADIIVVLQELYMSSMLVSSTCSVDSSWVGANGCWSTKHSNCYVLISCLLKAFQWCSRCPRETYAIMIQEWHVGHASRTGWKMTDSPNSFPDEFVVRVNMNRAVAVMADMIFFNQWNLWWLNLQDS